MILLANLIFLISLALPLQTNKCQCQKVKDSDTPARGNVNVLMNGGRVKRLQGVVRFPNGEAMKDAIVEVYENRSTSDYENISSEEMRQSISRKRKAACMTGEDGGFCFTNLPPGRYLLIAGHRSDGQFSAVHVVVKLDPHGKGSTKEGLIVELAMSI